MKGSFCLFLFVLSSALAQSPNPTCRTIAFYNVENLFDTIDDTETFDEDYTRMGKNQFSSKDYRSKISKLASVIPKIGGRNNRSGPDIIGVSEVENRQVLEDLVSEPELDSLSYAIIHENSPDRRGIDVALLYREGIFFPLAHESVEVRIWDESGDRIYTRDVLWVHGILDGEEIHLLINHWPSRRGGSSRSAPKRMKAAWVNREIIRKINQSQPGSKILVLGDFNDDPIDRSITDGLSAKSTKNLGPDDFFNPMAKMFKKGWNTLVYRDQIHLFDQILLSYSLVQSHENHGFRLKRAGIFNPGRLLMREGKYKGYPFRSFENGRYSGGYSDHFPVYVELVKP